MSLNMVSHNCWSPTIGNKYLNIEIWYLREGSVNSIINNFYIQFEFSYGKEVFEATNALTLPSDYSSLCYICVLYSKILLMLISGFCKIPHINFTPALTHQGWETYMCQYTIPLVTLLSLSHYQYQCLLIGVLKTNSIGFWINIYI